MAKLSDYVDQGSSTSEIKLLDSITTSATATYALTKNGTAYSPDSARNLIVSLNGVTQAPQAAYTVSGSNIVFDSALTSADVIDYILVIGSAISIGTPSDGTVGTAQMSYPLGNFSSTGIDDNATSTAITIDSSERVGIGTGSDAINGDSQLHVKTGNISGMMVETTADSYAHLQIKSSEGWWGLGLRPEHNGALSLRNNATGGVPLYIDETGNVLVAKTALDNSTVGCRLNSTGDASFVCNGNRPLVLVRKSNSGDHLIFLKDSTTVGAIGDEGGDSLYIQSGDAGLRFSDGANAIFPAKENGAIRDNGTALGMTSARFDDAYIYNGVTSGSDEREKQEIAELDEAETRVAVACKGLLRKWRWKSAVEEKGDDARIHFGIIAQDLKAAFEAEGLDAGRYGMFMHDTWTDEETGEECDRMGIRYTELLAFIIAAI